mmetsp:Transcript_74495/g.206921  ORF Transcript_74495/g.206921 Transcript_74495/m.206921 type:complete len:239 (+) Transcript_74495:254-970(+)
MPHWSTVHQYNATGRRPLVAILFALERHVLREGVPKSRREPSTSAVGGSEPLVDCPPEPRREHRRHDLAPIHLQGDEELVPVTLLLPRSKVRRATSKLQRLDVRRPLALSRSDHGGKRDGGVQDGKESTEEVPREDVQSEVPIHQPYIIVVPNEVWNDAHPELCLTTWSNVPQHNNARCRRIPRLPLPKRCGLVVMEEGEIEDVARRVTLQPRHVLSEEVHCSLRAADGSDDEHAKVA